MAMAETRQEMAVGLQLIVEMAERWSLIEQTQTYLTLLIQLKYGHYRNYIGPLAKLVFNLTGFAFKSFAFDQLAAAQSSEITKLVEHLKTVLESKYLS
jgi:hypothetical protein